MKHILNKKMFVLAMAAALVAAMAAVLSGNGSGSQPVRTAGAAGKVRFDDTEILKSPLLTRYGGNKWKLVSTFTCTKRNECLSCDLIQFGNEPAAGRPSLPFMRLILLADPAGRSQEEWYGEKLTALRVTVGSSCYSFRHIEMYPEGFAYVSCGSTARSMLADLSGCDRATFEVDYEQYGTGEKRTFTAAVSRAKLSEWRTMAGLLENSHLWDAAGSLTLSLDDEGAAAARR